MSIVTEDSQCDEYTICPHCGKQLVVYLQDSNEYGCSVSKILIKHGYIAGGVSE